MKSNSRLTKVKPRVTAKLRLLINGASGVINGVSRVKRPSKAVAKQHYAIPNLLEVEARLARAKQVMAKPLSDEVKAKLRRAKGAIACGPLVK